MLLNIVEERVYIGQTKHTVLKRIAEHWSNADHDLQTPLSHAMRKWPQQEYWTYVVLQNCYSTDELNSSEERWINYCCSADTAIGYNVHRTAHVLPVQHTSKPKEKKVSAFSLLTPEEKSEFFRNCGKKGALKAAENIMLRSS